MCIAKEGILNGRRQNFERLEEFLSGLTGNFERPKLDFRMNKEEFSMDKPGILSRKKMRRNCEALIVKGKGKIEVNTMLEVDASGRIKTLFAGELSEKPKRTTNNIDLTLHR